MKLNIPLTMLCLTMLSLAGVCTADRYDCEWYNNSWIHTHISTNPLVSDMPFVIHQIDTVRPDAIQYHTHNLELMLKSAKLDLYNRFNFKPVATINHAGTWYPYYEDSDKYVFRINPDGSFAGRWLRKHLCFNAPAVDEIIIPQFYIDIPAKVKPAQVWIDESLITVNVCYCKYCTRLYQEQYGAAPPVELTEDNFEEWQQWIRFHRDVYEKWMEKITKAVHSVDPDILVTFNTAYFMSQPEMPPAFIKNLSHDVHKDPLEAGMFSRYAGSGEIPFDIMPGLGQDIWAGNQPKTIEQIYNDISVIVPHGGIWNIGEFPTSFTNLREESKYRVPGYRRADLYLELAQKGAAFARERQPFCQHTRSVADVALLQSASTHYAQVIFNMAGRKAEEAYSITSDGTRIRNTEGINSRIYWPNNKYTAAEVIGAYEALMENHLRFDIINEDQLQRDAHKYRLLVLSEQQFLEKATVQKIREFVKNGGCILATGSTVMADLADMFGVKIISKKPHADVKLRFDALEIDAGAFWEVQPSGAEWLASSTMPQRPGATLNSFGKGKAIYVAGNLFNAYYVRSGYSYTPKGDNTAIRGIVRSLVEAVFDSPVRIQAPAWFEFVQRTKNQDMYLHWINRTINWKQKKDYDGPIKIRMSLSEKPATVVMQPGAKPVEYRWDRGTLSLEIDPASIEYHSAIQISPAR